MFRQQLQNETKGCAYNSTILYTLSVSQSVHLKKKKRKNQSRTFLLGQQYCENHVHTCIIRHVPSLSSTCTRTHARMHTVQHNRTSPGILYYTDCTTTTCAKLRKCKKKNTRHHTKKKKKKKKKKNHFPASLSVFHAYTWQITMVDDHLEYYTDCTTCAKSRPM